jgi:2,3,4,5-tetrahydropyridine-2-carboxylate N-succinyltransferase
MNMENYQAIIEEAFTKAQEGFFKLDEVKPETIDAIRGTVNMLNEGQLRVAEKKGDAWVVNEWTKKAILLYFRVKKMKVIEMGSFSFVDKIPLKKWKGNEGVRVVPHALVRKGAFISSGAILMPSYVNIGAFVGTGSMVDTWATVGSCAQIGAHVHLSGGVGIGGVLEPVQAQPVIIEDHAFIGSRSIIVEGTIVEEGAVVGAGVTITGSTKIIDVSGSKEKHYTGRIPRNSVVIPGTYRKKFPAGEFGVNCALIIGERTESTDKKVSLTKALRDFDVSV